MTVGIIKSTEEEISGKLIELINLVGYKPSKNQIFLKPNIMDSAKPKTGVNVHPLIVETLYDYYKNEGYEVVIGEGPTNKVKPKEMKSLLRMSGYKKLIKEKGVEIVNLNDNSIERTEYRWEFGKIKLPKIIQTHEYINIACMKTHWITTVTLGLKNQKGLLLPKDKKLFHKRGLHKPILELSKICTPDFTIIDAINCVEGTGPTIIGGGKRKVMNLLVAGTDVLEVDNACSEIMGFDVEKIKHIPKVEYQTVGESIESVKSSFEPPKSYLDAPIGKTLIRLHVSDSSCTPMGDIVIDAFGKLTMNQELMQKISKFERIDISTGGAEFPDEAKVKICIGECSRPIAKKYNLIHVPGCPIDPDEFVRILIENL
ncbi:MAG: DUF362 domain-containing protein [Candidatus Helarchaeota archaeon]